MGWNLNIMHANFRILLSNLPRKLEILRVPLFCYPIAAGVAQRYWLSCLKPCPTLLPFRNPKCWCRLHTTLFLRTFHVKEDLFSLGWASLHTVKCVIDIPNFNLSNHFSIIKGDLVNSLVYSYSSTNPKCAWVQWFRSLNHKGVNIKL